MRRISVAALGVLIATTAFLAPGARAGEPEPDPRAESTASYDDIGWGDSLEDGLQFVLEGIGGRTDLSDDQWLRFFPGPNPTTDPALIERYGHPWIPERRTQFRASLTWDASDADVTPVVLETVLYDLSSSRALHRSRYESTRAHLLHPADGEVEVQNRSHGTVVIHTRAGQPPVATYLGNLSPFTVLQTVCVTRADTATVSDLSDCAAWTGEALVDSALRGWPALSTHWPDPDRRLTLPTHATMKATRLTPGEMRVVAGFRGTPTTARRASDHPWNVSTRYLRGGRTATDVTLTRMGDVAAARTELAHMFDNLPAGTDVVGKADTVFTTYRSATGVATTYQRTATGIVTASCHRWAAGTKAAAIRCAVDVADAQADKTRPVLRP